MEKSADKTLNVKIWKDTDESQNSPDFDQLTWDNECDFQEEFFEKSLSRLIFTLKSTGIQFTYFADKRKSLKHLTKIIIKEYNKLYNPKSCATLIDPYSSVNESQYISLQGSKILKKVFEMPPNGLFLNEHNLAALSNLLIGIIRDSSTQLFEEKAQHLSTDLLTAERTLKSYSIKLSEQDSEISRLKAELLVLKQAR
jgi:hypothetical protein